MFLKYSLVKLYAKHKYNKWIIKAQLKAFELKLVFLSGENHNKKRAVHYLGKVYFFIKKKYLYLCNHVYLFFKIRNFINFRLLSPLITCFWWSRYTTQKHFRIFKQNFYTGSLLQKEIDQFASFLYPYLFKFSLSTFFVGQYLWRRLKFLFFPLKILKKIFELAFKGLSFIDKNICRFYLFCLPFNREIKYFLQSTKKAYLKTSFHDYLIKKRHIFWEKTMKKYWELKFNLLVSLWTNPKINPKIKKIYKYFFQYQPNTQTTFAIYYEQFINNLFFLTKDKSSQALAFLQKHLFNADAFITHYSSQYWNRFNYKYISRLNCESEVIWNYRFESPPQRFNYLNLQIFNNKYKDWDFSHSYFYNYFFQQKKILRLRLNAYFKTLFRDHDQPENWIISDYEISNNHSLHETTEINLSYATINLSDLNKEIATSEYLRLQNTTNCNVNFFLTKEKTSFQTWWEEVKKQIQQTVSIFEESNYLYNYTHSNNHLINFCSTQSTKIHHFLTNARFFKLNTPQINKQVRAHYLDKKILAKIIRLHNKWFPKIALNNISCNFEAPTLLETSPDFETYTRQPIPKASFLTNYIQQPKKNLFVHMENPELTQIKKYTWISYLRWSFFSSWNKKAISFDECFVLSKAEVLGVKSWSFVFSDFPFPQRLLYAFKYKYLNKINDLTQLIIPTTEQKIFAIKKQTKTKVNKFLSSCFEVEKIHPCLVKFQQRYNNLWSLLTNKRTSYSLIEQRKAVEMPHLSFVDLCSDNIIYQTKERKAELYEYTVPKTRVINTFHSSAHKYFVQTFSEKNFWLSAFWNFKILKVMKNLHSENYSKGTLKASQNIDIEINEIDRLLNEQDFLVLPTHTAYVEWLISEESNALYELLHEEIGNKKIKKAKTKDVFTPYKEKYINCDFDVGFNNIYSVHEKGYKEYKLHKKMNKSLLSPNIFTDNQPITNTYEKKIKNFKKHSFEKFISKRYIISNTCFNEKGEYRKFEKENLWKEEKCPILWNLMKRQNYQYK